MTYPNAQLQAFLDNDENTMNPFTNASVGALLFRLANKYLPNAIEETKQSTAEKEACVHQAIELLKRKLIELNDYFKTSEEELIAVLAYLDHLIEQAPNELDKVTVFKDGEIITCIIPLKEVLALVFKALTDKEAFRPAIKQAFPDASDEEKEATLNENEKNYLLTFYNTLNRLRQGKASGTSFCHTGVRNDIACSLNGVYPEVHIIEQVDTTISNALQEFVLKKLKEKTAAEQFRMLFHKLRENVLSDETSDFEAFVSDQHFQQEAKAALERFCLYNGLNPNDETLAEMIRGNLNNLLYIPAPLNIHPHAVYLQELINFAYLDKTLPEAARKNLQDELDSLESFEDIEKSGLLNRLKAAHLWRTVKKYENVPFVGKEEAEFAISVKALLDFLQTYFQPNTDPADVENNSITSHIAIIEEQEKKEPDKSFVENFFAHWLKAGSPNEREPLRNRLLAEMPKLLLTDIHLTMFFAHRAENNVVIIEQHVINRILLHAMLSPVENWTPSFHDHLCRIIAFIQNYFKENAAETALSVNAEALRRDSYPDHFLRWFVVLEKLYLKVNQNQSLHFKVATDAFQAGMLELNPIMPVSFIERLGYNFFKTIITDGNELVLLLKLLDEDIRFSFINHLGYGFIRDIIKNVHQLRCVLRTLKLNSPLTFINGLGYNFLKTIITDGDQLLSLLGVLDNDDCFSFISALGYTFIKNIIQNTNQLIFLLRQLEPNYRLTVINGLEYEFVRNIISSCYELSSLLALLEKNSDLTFINNLGYDFIRDIIKNGPDLSFILIYLGENERATFISALGDHVQTIIPNGYELNLALFGFMPILIREAGINSKDISSFLIEHVLKNVNGTHAQLRYLIQLDKKELVENINPQTEAMVIYVNYYRFAQGQEPFAASKAILENYIQQPKGNHSQFFQPAEENSICIRAVRDALADPNISSIDMLLSEITKTVPLKEIESDLYERLQYISAFSDKPLEAYGQELIVQQVSQNPKGHG